MTCTSSTSKDNIVDLTECNQSSDAPDSPTQKKKSNYAVYIPSLFFQKMSSAEKSSVYKCLMGCTSKTVTVSNLSLCNARRHVENRIIQDMNSLRTVEKGGFNWLIEGLIGNLKERKRTFFTEKLKRDYSNTKTTLCMALEKASFVPPPTCGHIINEAVLA